MSLLPGISLKPKRSQSSERLNHLKKYARASLGTADLSPIVKLPEGEDLTEWLVVNLIDFLNQMYMIYGTVTEFCTPQQCPVMSAGNKYEYSWQEGYHYRKAPKISAPEYVDQLMSWMQTLMKDNTVFPEKIGDHKVEFPKQMMQTLKLLAKRIFRVYAHVYLSHFPQICALSLEAHLNTSYHHFLLFIREFSLVDKKELSPLNDLNMFMLTGEINGKRVVSHSA